ncbi:uncharacterized protein PRCAT00004547001 [Priceomyces carsonii]|uniref:uncharacterized protein n=1 Tax=Priceomyces carsonii TaxID=28549 RepID=UPI002EDB0286|nr:unnamed protein product [Priceomyces carsonii]
MDNINRIDDRKSKAKLAEDFNEFYTKITSPEVSQIGNYHIIREIGEGAFGKAYLAVHVLLNIKVVLKCGLIDDHNMIREIYYHRQLKHKNIVQLYEVIKTENHLWIALEYCEGGELFYYICEKKCIEYSECQRLFFQIVIGLQAVHSLNLCHRDLKLENILLADKKKSLIKLTDFGFVREYKRLFLSTICGTAVYMAPELLNGEKYSGFAIDIWSLGVILFTMLYGEMPFDDDDDIRTKYKIVKEEPYYRDTIPQETKNLLKKMLSKDSRLRPSINDILNSSFLIDLNNKHTSRNRRSDTESIISINQHYSSNKQAFHSRTEKIVLKKLKKLCINTKKLQKDVLNNDMNPLTAYFELALTREFSKKKKRHYQEKKRYYEAKQTLKKSKAKVKNALISDTQPIERIISGLSLSSNRTSMHKLNDAKKGDKPSEDAYTGLGKTVSFSTMDSKGSPSNATTGATTAATTMSDSLKKKQPKQILNKLQFWKRNKKDDDYLTTVNDMRSSDDNSNESAALKSEKLAGNEPPDLNDKTLSEKSPELLPKPVRTRPSSLISQLSQGSQISQFSQMSTLMTESELENLDETDTMDEDYDEDIYESSLSTSQDRILLPALATNDSVKTTKGKPAYRRSVSSDYSLNGAISKHHKRSSISQLSTTSSETSSFVPSPDQQNSSITYVDSNRPSSPDLSRRPRKAAFLTLDNRHPARSYSPPVIKKYNRPVSFANRNDSRASWKGDSKDTFTEPISNGKTTRPLVIDEEVEGEF